MSAVNVHPKNKLNELNASEWISRTVSVFVQKGLGKNSDEAFYEKLHPAPYSFTDVMRFIEFFTKSGGKVLDPFGGVGSTAKAAARLGRFCTSVEISPYFAGLARERLTKEIQDCDQHLYSILEGDIREVWLTEGEYDLILTSPPYWGILDKVDHKAKQERIANGTMHNYGDLDGDLSKVPVYEDFVAELATIFSELAQNVRSGGHCVAIVGDFRHKSRYHMFHSDLAAAMEDAGEWALRGVKIMYQKHKRVFPYGYPYSYVPNLHHQYALIFQKAEK
jgi:DNA modification methylase